MDTPAVDATSSSQAPGSPGSRASVSVSPKTNAPLRHGPLHQTTNSDHGGRQRSRSSGDIHTLCVEFMSKIHDRFGPNSAQWIETNSALFNFRHGDLSKRGAHKVMIQVLGNNTELQQGLFDILNHNDADWDPNDWSQPILSLNLSQTISTASPDTLQTENEPRLTQLPSLSQVFGAERSPRSQTLINPTSSHLPPMHANVSSSHYDDQGMSSHNPPSFGSQPTHGYYEEQFSPTNPGTQMAWGPRSFMRNDGSYPASSTPDPNTIWQHHAPSPWRQYTGSLMSENALHDPRLDPALPASNSSIYETRSRPEHSTPQQSYGQSQYSQGLNVSSTGDPRWQYGQHQTVFGGYGPRDPYYPEGQNTIQSTPERLGSIVSTTGIDTPRIGPAPENLPSHGPYNDPQVRFPNGTQERYSLATIAPDYVQDSPIPVVFTSQLPSQNNVTMFRVPVERTPGRFVHAICGKAFPSRSAVKKHHWGPKLEDVNTKRGCWFKHNRPAVAWDAHESCQGTTLKNLRPSTGDSTPANTCLKAPFAPPMVPGHSQTSHRQPPAQGIESSVSATSFPKGSEVCEPQDNRSDSVVAHLDAQTAATKQTARQLPPWMTPSGYGSTVTGNNFHSQMRSPIASSDTVQEQSDHTFQSFVVPSQNWEATGSGCTGTVSSKGTSNGEQNKGNPDTCAQHGGNEKRQRASNGEGSTGKDEQTQLEMAPSTPKRKKQKVEH